jgi:hypothetical protein
MTSKALLLATAGVLAANAIPADAGQWWPVFAHRTIKLTGIYVGANSLTIVVTGDTETWTMIRPDKHKVSVHVDIEMKKGEIVSFALKQLNDVVHDSGEFSPKPKIKRLIEDLEFEISTGNLGTVGVAAIAACNNSIGPGENRHVDRLLKGNFDSSIDMEVTANRSGNQITRGAFTLVPFDVKCLALPQGVQEPPAPVPPPTAGTDDLKPGQKFKVKSARLDVHEPKSNACPTEVGLIAKFETNFDGKVTFIYRRAGGGKSKAITVASKQLANGKFMAVHSQPVPIAKATDTKYMVEVVGKGIVSDWVTLSVPCKVGLGGAGGMAPPPEVPMKALSAQLGIQGPKTKVCPNTAKMAAWIKTNKAGKIGFRLKRKDGPAGPLIFAEAVKAGSGYMATYKRTLPITQPIDQAYSVVVPGSGGVASPFVPLKASCSVGLPDKVKS